MRLTLRTLLAYLDGILEPADAEDLGKKVEESEFATSLVHRIHDVLRRLRLGAPSLTDRNPKVDPNTVAEYLDNTLPSEAVTDFEKLCLDSDVHLAEVAASHQILTLVLGEPAEIDPASRQRMYQYKNVQATTAEPPAIPQGASAEMPIGKAPPSLDIVDGLADRTDRKARPRPTVPEYLRESSPKMRWLTAAGLVVLTACFVGVVLLLLGQFSPGTPLGNLLVRWGIVAASPKLAESPSAVMPATKDTRATEPKSLTDAEPKKSPEPLNTPSLEPKETTEIKPAANQPAEVSEPAPAKAPEDASEAEKVLKPEVPPKPAGVSDTPLVEREAEKEGAPDNKEAKTEDSAEVETDGASAKEPPETPPLPPEPIARFMSSDQVLLREDAGNNWIRVGVNQMLVPQRLLALPTYRDKVTMTIGATLEILGGTQVELLGSSPRELPGVRIFYGRVVIMPLAKAGSQIRVAFGRRSGIMTFSDAESVAALEVRRIHLPGADPEMKPSHIAADLYAASGGVLWEEADDKGASPPQELKSGQWINFNGELTAAPMVAKELPKWITAEPIGALDRRASVAVAQALTSDRLARVGLLELSTTRPQKEVKWLALRCLGYVGQYRDMVAALNDPAHKLDWPDYIDELRAAVARDEESAAAVRTALEKQYPQQAEQLYRMLWGYTDKDLENGADRDLVKALDDNDTLAVRVLGFWNLKDLTGLGLFYRPEQSLAKRQQPLQRWRQRLEDKEIRQKTAEEKIGAAAAEKAASPEGGP